MKSIGKNAILICLAVLLVLPSSSALAEIVLIANPGISESSLKLTHKEVQRIFLRKKKTLSGTTLQIAIQRDRTLHAEFLRDYVHKTSSQFNRYYKKLVFTGKGKPPVLVTDDTAMLSYVAKTPGAIGYVSKDAADETVTLITTD
jgi:ABC-type phosphate transport system substrate-binding protein